MNDQEREAIIALRGGNIRGLEALVRLHQLRALRTAYNITGDRQLAEDIVADAFLTVHDRIGQFDSRRPFEPWFYRIVVNGALKALRKTSRSPTVADEDTSIGQADPALGPEMNVLLRETRLLLWDAVGSLPPKQRAVVVLRHYLDLDERTIAQTLGCPLGTVKWRLHAARSRLRRILEQIDAADREWGYAPKGETT